MKKAFLSLLILLVIVCGGCASAKEMYGKEWDDNKANLNLKAPPNTLGAKIVEQLNVAKRHMYIERRFLTMRCGMAIITHENPYLYPSEDEKGNIYVMPWYAAHHTKKLRDEFAGSNIECKLINSPTVEPFPGKKRVVPSGTIYDNYRYIFNDGEPVEWADKDPKTGEMLTVSQNIEKYGIPGDCPSCAYNPVRWGKTPDELRKMATDHVWKIKAENAKGYISLRLSMKDGWSFDEVHIYTIDRKHLSAFFEAHYVEYPTIGDFLFDVLNNPATQNKIQGAGE